MTILACIQDRSGDSEGVSTGPRTSGSIRTSYHLTSFGVSMHGN